jgi:exonuclease III
MSYNLMGWNAFNLNKWRGETVLDQSEAGDDDVLGCQEVEKGGYGYDEVRETVEAGTSMSHSGGGQFFKDDSLEKLSEDYTNLMSGYWMSMTRYQHKASGVSFLFFNSHWKHGYGTEQASIVASFVDERRKEFGNLPAVLVGDTNQFCRGYERSAWMYLKGEQGSSPIIFEDALQHDQGKSFSDHNNPDCRVDLIFVSKGDWIVRQSDVDRDGMGADGTASDHAPLMAELIPIKK